MNLEVLGALATALGTLRKIKQLRGEMAELKGMDISKLDKLRAFAFVLAHTHTVYRGALGPTDPNGAMAEELVEIRDHLTSVGVEEQDPVVLTAATLLRDQAFTTSISAYGVIIQMVATGRKGYLRPEL